MPCLLLAACAAAPRAQPRATTPGAAQVALRDTADSTPALPTLVCPPGTQAVEERIGPPVREPTPRIIVIEDRPGSCCVGGCEPRVEPVWYAATLCKKQFEGRHVVRAVACRSPDGKVNGPFIVLANQTRIDGACTDDRRDGAWSWIDDWRSQRPRTRERGTFVDGRRDGPWTLGSADGGAIETGRFADGRRVGVWDTMIFEAGHLVESRVTRSEDGVELGASWDASGAPRWRSVLVDGRPHGVQERWADGVRSTRTYDHGRQVGSDEWFNGGHSLCTTSPDGDERCRRWDATGALRLEGTRAAGADRAQWTAWYPTGELLGTTTSRGSLMYDTWATTDGRQQLWYRDGTPLADMTCDRGNATGPARVWYPDGTLHFDDIAGPPYLPGNFVAFAPDGTPSKAAQTCGEPAMSCQLRGSSARCQALWSFTISVVPYLER